MSRCSGHCCHVFYLPIRPTEFAVRLGHYERWFNYLANTTPELRAQSVARHFANGGDIAHLLDERQITMMLVPLAATIEALPPDLRAIYGETLHDAHKPGGYFYTCRHFDEAGDCSIYESRPNMCREYPYGRAQGCQYAGCTMARQTVMP